MLSQRRFTAQIFTHQTVPQRAAARARRLWPLVALWLVWGMTAASQEHRFVPGRILVKPKAHLSEAEFSRRVNARGAVHRRTVQRTNIRVLAVSAEQTESVLAAMQNDPDIEFAERDYLAHSCDGANDP